MKIARPLTAVGLAALLALAGCSSGDDEAGSGASGQPSESGQPSAPADEQGADPGAGGAMEAPEAEVDNVPDVVAEVNGEEITRDEFVANYEGSLQQAAMSEDPSQINQDELKQQVAQSMVDNRLLTQAATEAGIEPTEEDIDNSLADIAAQSGMTSGDEVVAALEEQGMTEEEVRAEAGDQFRLLTYIENEADIAEPSDEELHAQYDAYVEQMSASGQDAEVPKFEEMRDQLAQQAVSQQQNAAAEEILTGLREDADVTINL